MTSSSSSVLDSIRKSTARSFASLVARTARQYQAALETPAEQFTSEQRAALGLLDFVPAVSPHLESPRWLGELASALEQAAEVPTRLIINTPPQHGKSTLIFHFLAWVLLRDPTKRLLYLTYNEDFSASQMREAKPTALSSGVVLRADASRGLREWLTPERGGLYATGVGGAVTGRPAKVIVVDDPIKDWAAAQSRAVREATDSWLKSSVLTRMHPDSSVIVVQTRWHEDDISGRLIQRGWDSVNLPAIGADGAALWPEHRPVEWLEEQREQLGSYVFEALFQGRPRPIGGEVFEQPSWCRMADLPPPTRSAIGVDLAYTAKTHADSSVRVDLIEHAGVVYVAGVTRKQVKAPDFVPVLQAGCREYPGAPMWWHCAGPEMGAADFIAKHGVPIKAIAATTDKLVRAMPAAAAWNAGKIRVPSDAAWAPSFVDEVCAFTGVQDPHDDQVDALASGFAALQTGRGEAVRSSNPRLMRTARDAY